MDIDETTKAILFGMYIERLHVRNLNVHSNPSELHRYYKNFLDHMLPQFVENGVYLQVRVLILEENEKEQENLRNGGHTRGTGETKELPTLRGPFG